MSHQDPGEKGAISLKKKKIIDVSRDIDLTKPLPVGHAGQCMGVPPSESRLTLENIC